MPITVSYTNEQSVLGVAAVVMVVSNLFESYELYTTKRRNSPQGGYHDSYTMLKKLGFRVRE